MILVVKKPTPYLVNVTNKSGHHIALISTHDSGFVSALENLSSRGDPFWPYRIEVTTTPANGKKKT